MPPPEHDPDARFRTEHLRADLGKRAVRGGALAIVTQGVKFVLNLVAMGVIARYVLPAEQGLVFMVTSVTGLLGLLKEFGLPTAAIQKAELSHRLASTLFWLNAGAGLATTALTAALAPMIAAFYGEQRLTMIAIVWGTSYFIEALAVQHEALMRRQMRFSSLAVAELSSTVLSALAGIAAAIAGFGYWSLIIRQLALVAVKSSVVWLSARWLPGPPTRGSGAGALMRAGGEMTGESLLLYLSRNLDNVLIGWRWGSRELGIYGRAYYLLLMPVRQIIWPLEGVALPLLSRLQNEPARYREAYLRLLEKIAMLTMPPAALVIAVPDWIITVFLGPAWVDASAILALLGIAALTEPVLSSTNWLFITQARTRELLHAGFASASLTVAAIVAGLPWRGVGVAAAIAASSVLARGPLLIGWASRRGPVETRGFIRSLAPSLCAALASVLALLALRRVWPGVSALPGLAAACALVAVTTLLVFLALPASRTALVDARSWVGLLRRNAGGK